MAETLVTTLNAQLTALLTNASVLDVPADYLNLPTLVALSLASGTAAGQANQLYRTQRTLTAGSTDSVSMYNFAINGGSAGTDPLGQALLLSKVKILIVQNLNATESNALQLFGDGTSAAWTSPVGSNTDKVNLQGNSTFILFDPGTSGYGVVSPTNHLFKIFNTGSGSVTYNLIVIGTT